jgi:hypothetical protein
MHHTRKALLASLLVAMTVVLGQDGIPNVEVMTIIVFVSGYLLGWWLGVMVGAVSMTLFSVFNASGVAMPPLLATQVVAFAGIGLAGALVGPLMVRSKPRWIAALFGGLVGFALTVMYDLLTNIGGFYSFSGGEASPNLVKYVAAGMAFMAVHVVWNTALFLVVLTPVLHVLTGYRAELQGGDR